MKRLLLTISLGAALLTAPVAAMADTRDDARAFVYQGDDLFAAQHYDEALGAYLRAVAIYDVPTTRIEVARTLLALGRLTDANEMAASLSDAPGFAEPEAFVSARARARELGKTLKERIPTVRVVKGEKIENGAEVVVRSGSKRYLGRVGEEVMVDPGTYTVEVSGASPMSVTIVEREHRDVTMTEDGSEPVKSPSSSKHGRRSLSPLVISSIAVSAAGLTLGTIAGSIYLGKRSSLMDDCRRGSAGCSSDDLSSANAIGWTANAGFGVAVAGGAVAVIGAMVDRRAASREPVQGLIVSPTYLGYRGRFE